MILITSDLFQAIFSLILISHIWSTSDFSIHLLQLILKVQMPVTFLFVNKKHQVCKVGFFKVGTRRTFWYQNN